MKRLDHAIMVMWVGGFLFNAHAEIETPFNGIGESALGSFQEESAWLQILGFASTPALVYSGMDTKAHNMSVRNSWMDPYTIPAVWGGYLLPLIGGAGVWSFGAIGGEYEATRIGSIVLQSTLLSFTYQSALKLTTGRRHPDSVQYQNENASQSFRFGFNRGGIDWGWPSGLMMINTSSLVALNSVYSESSFLKIGSAIWLSYVFISNPIHEIGTLAWVSDAVAGTLMGFAIGRSVGKTFSNRNTKWNQVQIFPIVGSAQGLTIQVRI